MYLYICVKTFIFIALFIDCKLMRYIVLSILSPMDFEFSGYQSFFFFFWKIQEYNEHLGDFTLLQL